MPRARTPASGLRKLVYLAGLKTQVAAEQQAVQSQTRAAAGAGEVHIAGQQRHARTDGVAGRNHAGVANAAGVIALVAGDGPLRIHIGSGVVLERQRGLAVDLCAGVYQLDVFTGQLQGQCVLTVPVPQAARIHTGGGDFLRNVISACIAGCFSDG